MSTKSIEQLKPQIVAAIARHLDPAEYKIFLFGSRAEGVNRERSDIDVGLDGPRPISFAILGRIREELGNLPTLYKIDVVDFQSVSPDFRTIALRHIEPLSLTASIANP